MSLRADVTALVLAGGRATRLGGIDKRDVVVGGQTIFERQVAVLAPRVAEIIVSLAAGDQRHERYRTVTDAAADIGPLAGIAAGLAAARTPWVLVVAGDMPGITGPVVDCVLASTGSAIDAVGIRIGGHPEPLFCMLAREVALAVVERRIAAGQRKASRLLEDGELRVCWITEATLRAVDPELRAFANVNTPADLDA
jgi:molybdenum cofactor guanylyltransferase